LSAHAQLYKAAIFEKKIHQIKAAVEAEEMILAYKH